MAQIGAAAEKRGLLVTGGSDYHGATRKDVDLGTGLSRWTDQQVCRGRLLRAIEDAQRSAARSK